VDEVFRTAEMERKKEIIDKKQKEISQEERRKKLEKLRLLKAKLAQLEKEEKQKALDTSANASTSSGAPISTENSKSLPPSMELKQASTNKKLSSAEQDLYLQQIDKELNLITEELAKDIEQIKFETDDTISEQIDKKLAQVDRLGAIQKPFSSEIVADSEIETELQRLEKEILKEQMKSAVAVSIFDKLCEEHEWINQPQYGFMYVMPDKKKDKKNFESWLDDWKKVLFDYAKIAAQHIIYFKKLLSEKPWSEFRDRINAIRAISDALVKDKIAEWLDKKKEKLRVYWRSLEEWADEIVNWAREYAYTEPIFIEDIRNADKEFSTLPEEDLIKIFNIIEKNGDGVKYKLKDGKVAITIKF